MAKSLDVGRSWRTYAKHDLMSSVVGQEVGVVNHGPALRDRERLVWIDLTAGDAALIEDVEWHRGCSPGILAHHAAQSAKPVGVILHEIQPATYDRLLANLETYLPGLGYTRETDNTWRIPGRRTMVHALNQSGQKASVGYLRRTDAVLVLNDPNAITEWAMRATFASEIADVTWCFRSLSTMGCNPGGLKRTPLTERESWFSLIGTQQEALPPHRDLLLAAIERDEAQWAYLLSTASKWRSNTESVVRSAFGRCGRTAATAWFRHDQAAFEETKRRLFLTKNELREQENPTLPFGPDDGEEDAA